MYCDTEYAYEGFLTLLGMLAEDPSQARAFTHSVIAFDFNSQNRCDIQCLI